MSITYVYADNLDVYLLEGMYSTSSSNIVLTRNMDN